MTMLDEHGGILDGDQGSTDVPAVWMEVQNEILS